MRRKLQSVLLSEVIIAHVISEKVRIAALYNKQ